MQHIDNTWASWLLKSQSCWIFMQQFITSNNNDITKLNITPPPPPSKIVDAESLSFYIVFFFSFFLMHWIFWPWVHQCWLTHWGRVTHICVSKLTIIASDNGVSPGRRQAIIWINAGILLIQPLRTNFDEILIEIHNYSCKKIHFK